MPSLLFEDLLMLIDIRMEHRVHIDAHQILEIRIIAARDRIDGLLRVRHRIQKRVQRPFHQLHERILDRILL